MKTSDALKLALQGVKKYVDDQIDENGFSRNYNDLENKPCWAESGESIEYTYNGDYANALNAGSGYVKISDDVPTYEQLLSGSYEVWETRQNEIAWTKTIKEHADAAQINIVSNNTGSGIFVSNEFCVIDTDGANLKGITFPEKGIYVVDKDGVSLGEMPIYVSKIIVQEEIVHQLDEKFIPDTIARASDLENVIEEIGYVIEEIENAIEENRFSGDYNDLTNKPVIPSIQGLASESYVNNAVTQLNDNLQGQIDDLFQNVSNGKELIASAITDKGVDASKEETFQSLSEKINQIPVGPPGSNIIGYINEENDIYVSLTELESGTYTLKFEDYYGLLDDFDDIGNVEVE